MPSDKPALSAAPINALRMWTDGRAIYTEIPGKGDCPCAVFRFPLHEQGLWKALHLLRSHKYEYAGEPFDPESRSYIKPMHPLTAAAGAILTRLGVTKK